MEQNNLIKLPLNGLFDKENLIDNGNEYATNSTAKTLSVEILKNNITSNSPKSNTVLQDHSESFTPTSVKTNERGSVINRFRDSVKRDIIGSIFSMSRCSSEASLNIDDTGNESNLDQNRFHHESESIINMSPEPKDMHNSSEESHCNLKRPLQKRLTFLKERSINHDKSCNISTINTVIDHEEQENEEELEAEHEERRSIIPSVTSSSCYHANIVSSSSVRIFYERDDDDDSYCNHDTCDLNHDINKNIKTIRGNFHNFYEEIEVLGRGSTATVKKCKSLATGEIYAVKITSYKGETERLQLCKKEFIGHNQLDHKNIVKVYELLIDTLKKKIYTIMELVEGQEMSEYMHQKGVFTEKDASNIFKQILSAIKYLHKKGICHRDIKPSNLLISDDGKSIKLTDFGVSKFYEDKERINNYSSLNKYNYIMWTQTGTKAFNPPEYYIDTEYTELFDIWSAGVTLYIMISGVHPFQAEYLDQQINKIIQCEYDLETGIWENISHDCKDLIRSCLKKNHKDRFTPSQALVHQWITKWAIEEDQHQAIDSFEFLQSLKRERHSSFKESLRPNSFIKNESISRKSDATTDSSNIKRKQTMVI